MELEQESSCRYHVTRPDLISDAYENHVTQADLINEAYENLGSIAAANTAQQHIEYNATGACAAPYLAPVNQHHFWTHGMHPYHTDHMQWAHYTDVTSHAMKSHTISAHSYAIARRNERERNRVRHINSTFERLRKHLPSTGRKRKLSKVDTLRTAIRYIGHLQDILDQNEPLNSKTSDKKDSKVSDNCQPARDDVGVNIENNNNNEKPGASVDTTHEDSCDSFASFSDNSTTAHCNRTANYFHDSCLLSGDLNSDTFQQSNSSCSSAASQRTMPWSGNFV